MPTARDIAERLPWHTDTWQEQRPWGTVEITGPVVSRSLVRVWLARFDAADEHERTAIIARLDELFYVKDCIHEG